MLSLVSSLFHKKREQASNKDKCSNQKDNNVSTISNGVHNLDISTNIPNDQKNMIAEEKKNSLAMNTGLLTKQNVQNNEGRHFFGFKKENRNSKNHKLENTNFNKKTHPCDDEDGHFIVVEGENFTNRFYIEKLLGQGTFGKVMKCYDRKNNKRVAIKVIRAIDKYREAAHIEIRVLKTLENFDPLNKYKCIRLNEWFDYKNHICMVFDLLGPSVFDFLKSNEFRPFSLAQVQEMTKQLLRGVAYMHHLNMVHTDLKPENILLVDNSYSLVDFGPNKSVKTKVLKSTDTRLIDFGSTTFEDEYHSSVVSTRHYRAPEIILELGWSFPCDLWSVGCIMLELLTGEVLFQTHENLEHLAMMEALIGKTPTNIISKMSNKLRPQFYYHNILAYPNAETSEKSLRNVRQILPLNKLVNPSVGIIHEQLYDLLSKLLRFNPEERLTALEALSHPFFSLKIRPSGVTGNKTNSLPNKGFKIEKYQFKAKNEKELAFYNSLKFVSATPRLVKGTKNISSTLKTNHVQETSQEKGVEKEDIINEGHRNLISSRKSKVSNLDDMVDEQNRLNYDVETSDENLYDELSSASPNQLSPMTSSEPSVNNNYFKNLKNNDESNMDISNYESSPISSLGYIQDCSNEEFGSGCYSSLNNSVKVSQELLSDKDKSSSDFMTAEMKNNYQNLVYGSGNSIKVAENEYPVLKDIGKSTGDTNTDTYKFSETQDNENDIHLKPKLEDNVSNNENLELAIEPSYDITMDYEEATSPENLFHKSKGKSFDARAAGELLRLHQGHSKNRYKDNNSRLFVGYNDTISQPALERCTPNINGPIQGISTMNSSQAQILARNRYQGRSPLDSLTPFSMSTIISSPMV
ncbi:hypothetical protein BB559_004695 [Furculomyces boomerangus]|uniref:Protein kinase domain-containing protein n=2 Tax=Harpellales TaxID=61421 RepID=A0A2T9YDD2_9FUNG|nr:hypothetical protein BB559_004695 [Furculomyces boomerangus]PWA03056.1 hypothetical protein BB558_000789 [Smittium angustum]